MVILFNQPRGTDHCTHKPFTKKEIRVLSICYIYPEAIIKHH